MDTKRDDQATYKFEEAIDAYVVGRIKKRRQRVDVSLERLLTWQNVVSCHHPNPTGNRGARFYASCQIPCAMRAAQELQLRDGRIYVTPCDANLENPWRLIVTYLVVTRGAWRVATGVPQERVWRNCWFVHGFRPLRRSPALAVTRQRWHVTTPDRRLAGDFDDGLRA